MNYLDFDIEEYEEDGIKLIKYLIDGKQVSKDIWHKIKQDRKEKFQSFVVNSANNNNKNNKQDNFNHKEEVCNCDRCNFIREVLDELDGCSDNDKFQYLSNVFNEFEDGVYTNGLYQGIETGSKQILRHFVEQMNQIIYSPMDVEFSGDGMDDMGVDDGY